MCRGRHSPDADSALLALLLWQAFFSIFFVKYQYIGEYSGIDSRGIVIVLDWKGYKLKNLERTFTVEEPFKTYPNILPIDKKRE